ncbi:adenine phosphoribosyltransferase [Hoyosella rhizosphaerae]|uniref:adenine phosphoribosyltransferase n=1 Tax=Hoyosella rhizosphaerae TaxID=1755582 RepID=UPI00166CC1C8|nr:adenine phosphoribosyltransferase [Hoyosella rhizosphaerae]MBN4926424.1 adenine phosphoribosyltransferase [Hoyosella rhizosphaerae]
MTARNASGDEPLDIAATVEALTRTVHDFPRRGVTFADLSPLFTDAHGLRLTVEALARAGMRDGLRDVDLVAGIDSRGFLLGAGVAMHLNTGMLPVRKAGKLPPPVLSRSYSLEYGEAALEIPASGLSVAGRRVLVIDDVLATGGTLEAAIGLLSAAGASVVAAAVVLEIADLGGRTKVKDIPLTALTVR